MGGSKWSPMPSRPSSLLHVLYDVSYNPTMYTILRSAAFDRWLSRLRDRQAVNRIVARLLAAEDGHLGDVRPVGGGVSEMRVQYGAWIPGLLHHARR